MKPSWIVFAILALGTCLSASNADVRRGTDLPEPPPPPPGAPKPADIPCTCDDLRRRLDTAERMRDAYARAYREKDPIRWKKDLDARIGQEMGWAEGSVKAEAKPADDTTTPEQRKEARENCPWCTWICDVSMQQVHEGYHTWFRQYEGPFFNLKLIGQQMTFRQTIFVKFTELTEMGAHQAEATFLRDKIAEMEQKGECKGATGTPTEDEMKSRWEQADKEVRFHMEIPAETPSK